MTFVLWRYASKICSLDANIKILDGHNFFVFEDIDVILTLLYGLFRVESAARDSPAQSRQSAAAGDLPPYLTSGVPDSGANTLTRKKSCHLLLLPNGLVLLAEGQPLAEEILRLDVFQLPFLGHMLVQGADDKLGQILQTHL